MHTSRPPSQAPDLYAYLRTQQLHFAANTSWAPPVPNEPLIFSSKPAPSAALLLLQNSFIVHFLRPAGRGVILSSSPLPATPTRSGDPAGCLQQMQNPTATALCIAPLLLPGLRAQLQKPLTGLPDVPLTPFSQFSVQVRSSHPLL